VPRPLRVGARGIGMGRPLATLARVLVAAGLLAVCAIARGAPVDAALVARFEAASTAKEQQQIALEVQPRLADGPLPQGLDERLVKVLASRPALGHSRYATVLEAIGVAKEFSAASINAVAAGLVTDAIERDWPAYQTLRKILSAYQQAHGLPDQAYASLTQALQRQRPYWMVVEVLATIGEDDPRHDDALAAIADALGRHEHNGIRSAAVAGIARMTNGRPLSPRTLDALQKAAVSDDTMTIRLEAIALLATQQLAQDRKHIISQSLAGELITPTPGLWQGGPSALSPEDRARRAVELLVGLQPPPYPDHVIDALIAQTRSFADVRCIELLRANRPDGGYSDAHRKKLEWSAAAHHSEARRADLFALVAPQLDADSLPGTLEVFRNGQSTTARIAAAYALFNHYAAGQVPLPVVDVADGIVRTSRDAKLQYIAATLIARGDEAFSAREQRLLAGLKQRGYEGNVHHAFVELYGADRQEDLLVRYAGDDSAPAWFRAQLIYDLGRRATPGAALSDRSREALRQAVRATSDYGIVDAVRESLTAWQLEIPMTVQLKTKVNHSKALFVVLVLFALVDVAAFLGGLFRVMTAPLREGTGAARRAWMAVGWLALSAGMLVLLAFALLGFFGHNALPDPRGTLMLQIPVYVGSAVYLIVSRVIFKVTTGVPHSVR
jgi:hypothetical protein